ncbi:uncharacterized protein LOC129251382 [Anastrepha obliqua]|uniref:uncharacterized protein LOC129251382 n=1 Tax=Anastrepha obliqua TaxID=95512 RepID=UPI00240A0C82|nr:uncharacterized protein LOC129251382 [Anastrepha obliqua]
MAEDILHQMRLRTSNADLQMNEEIHNEAFILIEDMCLMLTNKVLTQIGMIAPNRPLHNSFDQELRREAQYDSKTLREMVDRTVPLLNQQQKYAYDTPMKVVNDGTGRFYFLDAPCGTGKTFLLALILATIRSQNGIALALASSGIAATLLEGG